jgi:hypothetical protein
MMAVMAELHDDVDVGFRELSRAARAVATGMTGAARARTQRDTDRAVQELKQLRDPSPER